MLRRRDGHRRQRPYGPPPRLERRGPPRIILVVIVVMIITMIISTTITVTITITIIIIIIVTILLLLLLIIIISIKPKTARLRPFIVPKSRMFTGSGSYFQGVNFPNVQATPREIRPDGSQFYKILVSSMTLIPESEHDPRPAIFFRGLFPLALDASKMFGEQSLDSTRARGYDILSYN